jgi:insertion element IS1 protein InsB
MPVFPLFLFAPKDWKRLELFGIMRFYTDGWGAYERHIDPEQHHVGKGHRQKIDSTHIILRTRIKR